MLAWQSPVTQRPEFSFRWNDLAAKKSWETLQTYDLDLNKALRAQPFSSLPTGSEFRPVSILEPLCHCHPLWSRVPTWLTEGVEHPLRPTPEHDRLEDLHSNFQRGNHQSASFNIERLTNMLKDEVTRGWQPLLPCEAALHLPQAALAPLGLVEQDPINEFGKIAPKWCLTHDQSFNVIQGTSRSVNDRLIMDDLVPCRRGRALIRHIHAIVGVRQRNPALRILQTKADWKSAYRCLHYNIGTAIQLMVTIGSYAFVVL